MVAEGVQRASRDVKRFLRIVGRKAREVAVEGWLKGAFLKWKKLSYIPEMNFGG